jgi:hypothetical protein
MRITSLSSLLAAGFVLISSASAWAQTPAVICGTVTDATGGIMPGVAVTLAPMRDTGILPAAATTDSKGNYLFPSVSIGTYTLSFTLEGFKKAVRPNITMATGFEARVDQRMELGLPAEDVYISALAPVGYLSRPTVNTKFTSTHTEGPPQPMKRCTQ